MNADETAVAAVLKEYETALNGSDAEAALKLYAPDGVFMPQHSPASVGVPAVRKAYDAVFAAITLRVRFDIAENPADRARLGSSTDQLRRANQNQCHGRRRSGGESGALSVPENRRGLEDRALLFCTTNPPRS